MGKTTGANRYKLGVVLVKSSSVTSWRTIGTYSRSSLLKAEHHTILRLVCCENCESIVTSEKNPDTMMAVGKDVRLALCVKVVTVLDNQSLVRLKRGSSDHTVSSSSPGLDTSLSQVEQGADPAGDHRRLDTLA